MGRERVKEMGTQMMRERDLFRLRELRSARGRELEIGGEGGRDVEDDEWRV
jgi:hypothetical protein